MPSIDLVKSVGVERTRRAKKVEGMFDLDVRDKSREEWSFDFDLPEDWSVGLIVGPSGSGKSTVARELWPESVYETFEWPEDQPVVDGFAEGASIKAVTRLLSSVGFSSPPKWLRPYRVLSRGERFRCDLARALSQPSPVVVDEFTSVVDRDVGQVASAAVAKTARRMDKQFVAVTCHEDVEQWLEPDWVLRPNRGKVYFPRGEVQRPDIELEIRRCSQALWRRFRDYHYLDESLNRNAQCFVGWWRNKCVAFTGVIAFPHPHVRARREHRTVCRPNFQGVGIGNAMSDAIAGAYKTTGVAYYSQTSHPAMIGSRNHSDNWAMVDSPSLVEERRQTKQIDGDFQQALDRYTASFRYVGEDRVQVARSLGIADIAVSRDLD